MKAKVELSYYPLQENFISEIKGFIDKLNKEKDFYVETNSMSTQITGDLNKIMETLGNLISDEFDKNRASFVMKIIKGE